MGVYSPDTFNYYLHTKAGNLLTSFPARLTGQSHELKRGLSTLPNGNKASDVRGETPVFTFPSFLPSFLLDERENLSTCTGWSLIKKKVLLILMMDLKSSSLIAIFGKCRQKKFFYLKKFEVVKNLSMEKKLKKKQCAKSVNSRMSFNIFLRYFLREEFFWQYHWDPQRERITLYMEELKRLLLVINGTTRCAR